MVKVRDYTGEKYGKLTAIKVSENKTPRGAKLWEFICECGNTHLAEIGDVKKSKTIGCKTCNSNSLSNMFKKGGKYEHKRQRKDYTGEKFGKLTVTRMSKFKEKAVHTEWEFICECGTVKVSQIKGVKCLKYQMCKSCRDELTTPYNLIHGKSGSNNKAYNAWKNIKKRCLNTKDKRNPTYKNLGMDDLYINDPVKFMEDLGEPPNDGKRYSVDRIDNNIGYMVGNIRWATDHQQASNKGKRYDSKTGVNGVHSRFRDNTTIYTATWRAFKTGKSKSVCFSANKYGDELAFFLACEARELAITKINDLGGTYSPTHGL